MTELGVFLLLKFAIMDVALCFVLSNLFVEQFITFFEIGEATLNTFS